MQKRSFSTCGQGGGGYYSDAKSYNAIQRSDVFLVAGGPRRHREGQIFPVKNLLGCADDQSLNCRHDFLRGGFCHLGAGRANAASR